MDESMTDEQERHICPTCKYFDFPITTDPCYSCIRGTDKWEVWKNENNN